MHHQITASPAESPQGALSAYQGSGSMVQEKKPDDQGGKEDASKQKDAAPGERRRGPLGALA